MAGSGDQRGLLKPKLSWPAAVAAKPGSAAPKPAAVKPAPVVARPKNAPSNAIPLAQYNLDQLKKMAASRGLTVEKLVAQMVQQYMTEGPDDSES